jgi:hypothetical protein
MTALFAMETLHFDLFVDPLVFPETEKPEETQIKINETILVVLQKWLDDEKDMELEEIVKDIYGLEG